MPAPPNISKGHKSNEAHPSSFCLIDAPPVVGTSYKYPIEKFLNSLGIHHHTL
jgi:hypothetical protein